MSWRAGKLVELNGPKQKFTAVFTRSLFPSKLRSITLSTVYQAFCQSFALFYVSADREKDGWRARLQAKVRYVARVCVCVSALLVIQYTAEYVAGYPFSLRIVHFAAKTQVLIGMPGQIMHALLFYKEKKTRFISCLIVFVPHTHIHTHLL